MKVKYTSDMTALEQYELNLLGSITQLEDVEGKPSGATAPLQRQTPTKILEDINVRPGARFIARWFDAIIFCYTLNFILYYCCYPCYALANYYQNFLYIFLWIFVESLLLSTWGTNPGKWLLKIHLTTHEGAKLDGHTAFQRSVRVWFFGLGMGVPFVGLFANYYTYLRLEKNKISSWDEAEHTKVTHELIPPLSMVVVVTLLLIPPSALLTILSMGKMSANILH